MSEKPTSIEQYIAATPEPARSLLEDIRRTIEQAAPNASETIRYAIPTFTIANKSLVHIAAWKNHIGLYPIPAADEAFRQKIAPYRANKSSARGSRSTNPSRSTSSEKSSRISSKSASIPASESARTPRI